mmetsp:Transcript_9/g.7  ORF Transcript_9/g.7 Transcript_9/m.7 type:complete len:101 (+) Transcript_9:114-416(+)
MLLNSISFQLKLLLKNQEINKTVILHILSKDNNNVETFKIMDKEDQAVLVGFEMTKTIDSIMTQIRPGDEESLDEATAKDLKPALKLYILEVLQKCIVLY